MDTERLFKSNERSSVRTLSFSESEQAPLPDSVPAPPDLTRLPSHILHSGTVETLIGQNEDLMSRLKVNVRRNAILEQQIHSFDSELKSLQSERNALKAKLQTLSEKDHFQQDKVKKAENEFLAAKQTLEAQTKAALEAQQEMRLTLADREHKLSELRERLSQTVEHVQNQQKGFQKDQSQLVQNYEKKLKELSEEKTKLNSENKVLSEKASKFAEISQKQIETENRAIFAERTSKEYELRLRTEVEALQKQLTLIRTETKATVFELDKTKENLIKEIELKKLAVEENSKLKDQFETLQTLWAEGQSQLEQLRLKYDSLTKVNQEISRRLKDQRRSELHAVQILEQNQSTHNATNEIQTAHKVSDSDEDC